MDTEFKIDEVFDMMRLSRGWHVATTCLAALLLAGGCGEGDTEDHGDPPPPGVAGGMPGGGGPGAAGIKQIMIKLAKGPNSLTPVIGNELSQDPTPWETIQAQTKEYSQSASEMGKYNPPKGTKESWLTALKGICRPGGGARPGRRGKEQRDGQDGPPCAQEFVQGLPRRTSQDGPRRWGRSAGLRPAWRARWTASGQTGWTAAG